MEVDPEALIPLVREQPSIWDRTHDAYKNKRLKCAAWKEIFRELYPGFEELSNEDKNRYGHRVMKKWTNIKDNWIKYDKKVFQRKTRVGEKKIRKYVFYDQMIFLKTVVEYRKNEPENNLPVSYNHNKIPTNTTTKQKTPNLGSSERFEAIRERKIQLETGQNNVEMKLMKYMNSIQRDDRSRSMNFFRGISETVDKFSDENMIDFQFQVISIIRNIQQRSHQGYRNETAAPNDVKTTFSRSSTVPPSGSGFSDPLISANDYEQASDGSEMESSPSRHESPMSFELVKEEILSDS